MTAIVFRHASAGDRAAWEGDDRLRPLDKKGRRQAKRLVPLLTELGARRIVSSPYLRCVQSVEPLAAALGVAIEEDERLAEGHGDAARSLLGEDGVVACTHGDVAAALSGTWLKKGAAAVVHEGRITQTIRARKSENPK